MSEIQGRDFEILDSTGEKLCLGVTTKGFEVANTTIDITSDDSIGWQTFMADLGEKAITLTIDGVFTDEALKTKALSATNIMFENVKVNDGKAILQGDWVVSSYGNTAEKDGAVMFSATLNSSGVQAVVAS